MSVKIPSDATDLDLAKAALRSILRDPDAQPAARANAARTMLEITGALGRYAAAPVDANRQTSAMSIADIKAELAGLAE